MLPPFFAPLLFISAARITTRIRYLIPPQYHMMEQCIYLKMWFCGHCMCRVSVARQLATWKLSSVDPCRCTSALDHVTYSPRCWIPAVTSFWSFSVPLLSCAHLWRLDIHSSLPGSLVQSVHSKKTSLSIEWGFLSVNRTLSAHMAQLANDWCRKCMGWLST